MENYEVICDIGRGSFGNVCKCRDVRSAKIVAIKTHFYFNNVIKRAIQREYTILTYTPRHDNIVLLLDVFLHERHHLCGVYEYLDHTLLDEINSHASLDEITLRRHIYQLLRAVDFLHQNNIIHRDIKPNNILVFRSGVLKLADFGEAYKLALPYEIHTPRRCANGYGSPEQILRDTYGKPVDVWAFGCSILYMAKCEKILFGKNEQCEIDAIITKVGPPTRRQEQLYCHRFGESSTKRGMQCKNPCKKFGICDPLLADLVSKCLQRDPCKRDSCSELLQHSYFTRDHFPESFLLELQVMVQTDRESDVTLLSVHVEQLAVSEEPSLQSVHEKEDTVSEDISPLSVHEEQQELSAPCTKKSTMQRKKIKMIRRGFGTDLKANKPAHLDLPKFHVIIQKDRESDTSVHVQQADNEYLYPLTSEVTLQDHFLQIRDEQEVSVDLYLHSVDDEQNVSEDLDQEVSDDLYPLTSESSLQELCACCIKKSTKSPEKKWFIGFFNRCLKDIKRFFAWRVYPEDMAGKSSNKDIFISQAGNQNPEKRKWMKIKEPQKLLDVRRPKQQTVHKGKR